MEFRLHRQENVKHEQNSVRHSDNTHHSRFSGEILQGHSNSEQNNKRHAFK
jgi:hypothetical protein